MGYGDEPTGYGYEAETALARRQREDMALKISGAAGGTAVGSTLGPVLVAVGVAFPPWSTIAASAAALGIAVTFGIIKAVRKRGSKILAGDTTGIKHFIKRTARWSGAKRKLEAQQLVAKYQRHHAKGGRHAFLKKKSRSETDTWRVKEAAYRMKLQVLLGHEIESRQDPHSPLDPDDRESRPVVANRKPLSAFPDSVDDIPAWGWIVGGAVIVGVVYMATQQEKR